MGVVLQTLLKDSPKQPAAFVDLVVKPEGTAELQPASGQGKDLAVGDSIASRWPSCPACNHWTRWSSLVQHPP